MRRHVLTYTLVAATLVCCWNAGCGKKDSEKSGKTNSAGGSGEKNLSKPAKDLLVGTWVAKIELDDKQLDAEVEKMVAAGQVPADKKEESKKAMGDMLSKMTMEVELKSDGTSVRTTTGMGPKPKVDNGTWKVLSEDGKVVQVEAKDEGEKKADTLTLTFTSDDEYTFETDDPEFKEVPLKKPLVFTRKK